MDYSRYRLPTNQASPPWNLRVGFPIFHVGYPQSHLLSVYHNSQPSPILSLHLYAILCGICRTGRYRACSDSALIGGIGGSRSCPLSSVSFPCLSRPLFGNRLTMPAITAGIVTTVLVRQHRHLMPALGALCRSLVDVCHFPSPRYSDIYSGLYLSLNGHDSIIPICAMSYH